MDQTKTFAWSEAYEKYECKKQNSKNDYKVIQEKKSSLLNSQFIVFYYEW